MKKSALKDVRRSLGHEHAGGRAPGFHKHDGSDIMGRMARAMSEDMIASRKMIAFCDGILTSMGIRRPKGGWEEYAKPRHYDINRPQHEASSTALALHTIRAASGNLRSMRAAMKPKTGRSIVMRARDATRRDIAKAISGTRWLGSMRQKGEYIEMPFHEIMTNLVHGKARVDGIAVDPFLCLHTRNTLAPLPATVKAKGLVWVVVGARLLRGEMTERIGATVRNVILYRPERGGKYSGGKYISWYIGNIGHEVFSRSTVQKLIVDLESAAMLQSLQIRTT